MCSERGLKKALSYLAGFTTGQLLQIDALKSESIRADIGSVF